MIILYTFTFSNFLSIFLGVIFSFLVFSMITSAIISKILSKYNKNEKIRSISAKAYATYFKKDTTFKERTICSLIYEVNEVCALTCPNTKYPLYELSINEVLSGVLIVQQKLKKLVNNPLLKDIKNVHIATLINLEENFAKPVFKIVNHKFFKYSFKISKVILMIINFINPLYYIKLIVRKTLFKQGKKDIILIGLDFIGNTVYEIYEKEEQTWFYKIFFNIYKES